MLTTYSFQARGFYEKEGYRVVGEMAGYPPRSGVLLDEEGSVGAIAWLSCFRPYF